MNNLALCQSMARESGIISGTQPSTVIDQAGRLLKIVEWISQGWVDIQNLHANWQWMQAEFSESITSGTAKYTPAAWSLTDVSHFLRDDRETDYQPHTIYLTATGVSDENKLREITWQDWRTRYDRGTQTNNRPNQYAISPLGEFCFGPIPDDTYTVQGEYRQSATVLALDADIPGLPAAYHAIIVWYAMGFLSDFDLAESKRRYARDRYQRDLDDLELNQLETIKIINQPLA